jgi:phosphoribosyl 1,2-cyclic phosphate phosphodiesterase
MALELVFLGTGTSAGVPMIGCDCEVCRSDDPRDHRSRPSVLVRYPDVTGQRRDFLIDTAPELRQQAIREGMNRVDGVLYTHAHADHVFGLDDLRRFNAVMKAPIDIYAEAAVLERFRAMFTYIFEAHRNVNPSFVATLLPHRLSVGEALSLYGATWTPIRLMHGRLPLVGYRVDYVGLPGDGRTASVAYCTDVSTIPPESYPLLADLDVLVIDALRYRHHPTHLTVDQALEVVDRVAPGRAYFTHIAHDIRHADLEPRLPAGVHLAYDGLRVEIGATPAGENAGEPPINAAAEPGR